MNALFSQKNRAPLAFSVMALLLIAVGMGQSWPFALAIINLCLISAIMSLGVNIQWGYAGLLNLGVMGFTALGGVAAVLISEAPVLEAWSVGGQGMVVSFILVVITIVLAILVHRNMASGWARKSALSVLFVGAYFTINHFYEPSVLAIENVNPATMGFLGGLGLPIIFSWIVGGVMAAGVAWVIGKITLGLRSDYLAIATLGISEIIIAVMKNEDWLSRGVKNVIGLPRPVPYEIDLQESAGFVERTAALGLDPVTSSSIVVKLGYAGLFSIVLVIVLILAQLALASPWGRMMRAIRDNEEAAEAMGKNVTARHLQIFILGSAICGVAGAMMTTLDSQLTPSSYQPLRFTFLVWVMVIVGGSGNNFGSVLGGFLIFFLWVQVEPMGAILMQIMTSGMAEDNVLRLHLLESVAHMRLLTMGLILILVLRFAPKGLIPEK